MRIDAEVDLLACFFPYQFRYASYSFVNFQPAFVRPLHLSSFVMSVVDAPFTFNCILSLHVYWSFYIYR